jgi:hypothetical protein
MRAWLLAAVVGLVCGVAHGDATKKKPFTVEGITFKLWDEESGKVLPLDKPSNPYGLNLTLMIIVKVKGPTESGTPQNLTLDVSAPAESDDATGDHPAWQKQLVRSVWSVGDKGAASFLFVMPYECSFGTTFTATIGASKKTVKQPLGCAK